jgi:ABC-2 type transport system ATP-binding protein
MISIEHLSKSYNKKEVVHIDVLEIPAGQCFGLVGNNGAGKTTLFRLILDLIRADAGTVCSFGSNVAQSEEWKAFTGSYLDENFLIPFLTADEYFAFVAKAYSITAAEIRTRLGCYKELFNGEILGQAKYIRDFSLGNKRKIGIIAALMVQPKVLVLDEPFANLDPSSQLKLRKLLQDIQSTGKTTMLISSHDLVHITSVCERIVLIEKGFVIKDLGQNEEMLKELSLYFAS